MSTNNSWNAPTLGVGNVYIGQSSGLPASALLTPGTGVTIVSTSGSIVINAIGGGLSWVDVSGTTVTMAANTGYAADNASLVTLTMPATAAVGSVFRVDGKGAGGWLIQFVSGQTCEFGSVATTTSTGSLASTLQFDCIQIRCITANTQFIVENCQGNITYI